jgi:hypothetical protein
MNEKVQRFNAWLAVKITNTVGSMWCAYVFTLLALISLPDAIHGGTAPLIAWIAQTFLQLVLLSIIMVGQDVASQKAEARAEEDHRMIKAEFELMKEEAKSYAELLQLLRDDLMMGKLLVEKVDHLGDEIDEITA